MNPEPGHRLVTGVTKLHPFIMSMYDSGVIPAKPIYIIRFNFDYLNPLMGFEVYNGNRYRKRKNHA